ncbi:peptidase domain-containing ABC transporter [Bacillus halotolerans]|uniref:peptidase domain-containing ABC transporter n=1 Tax=Bacillus halotolerans TaxID=260554 RepID=UPI002DB88899|nr:peptidase domain-containing ABC transporter [Bacillus halotolerans]MEC1544496.1 peptidase domain-containing ABC transporter [Bacillus halotolerans]
MKKKVPFVEQFHQTECGLCCAAMLLRYHGCFKPLNDLREIAEPGRDGLNLKQIYDLLKSLQIDPKVYRTDTNGLEQVTLPAILYWNENHFVILEKIKKNSFVIVDPNIGRRSVPLKEFEESFSAIVLVGRPNKHFIPEKSRERTFQLVTSSFTENRILIVRMFFLSFLTAAGTLAIPILIQNLTDKVMNHSYISIIDVTISILVLILFFFLQYTRGVYLIYVKSVLDQHLMKKIFKHLLKVPYKFFDARPTGDIIHRMSSIDNIRDLLSETAIKGILDVISLCFIFIYIGYKSITVLSLVLLLFLIYAAVSFLIRPKLKEITLYEMLERGKLQRVQIETITAIFNIKVSGLENVVYDNWKDQMNQVINRYKLKGKISNFYNIFTQSMQTLAPFVTLLLGFQQYINNQVTFGEVLAIFSITTLFFTTSTSIFQILNDVLLASTSMQRINDITDAKAEKESSKTIDSFKGDIQVKNVTFSYTKSSDIVLDNVNMHIKKGQKVAIVGKSGSGKSTLGKLLLGLYEPTNGDILYDGISVSEVNKKELRQSMGAVPQDIYLFNKSIYENIKMGKKDISYEDFIRALEVANIDKEVNEMPMKHRTLISNMGMNLSGGQRQRLALARALVNKPSVILLDEATSSLDSVNEAKVAEYFTNIGSTCIVIAHRLSTIIDSDVIFVMKNGLITEQGTHQELMNTKGEYFTLYSGHKNENNANHYEELV